jgi:Protein of unknown function (DUF2934)
MKKPVTSATQGVEGDTGTKTVDRDAIEARAYGLWVERGCPIGSPEVDWLRAEAELTEQPLLVSQSQAA